MKTMLRREMVENSDDGVGSEVNCFGEDSHKVFDLSGYS